MRSELLALVVCILTGCPEDQNEGPAPRRFEAVKRSERADKASTIFCEKAYSAGDRPWVSPPEQPVPGEKSASAEGGWRWINFWASWCGPCLEEMPLLKTWKQTFDRDGVPVSFELWSIDEDRDAFVQALGQKDRFPRGQFHWLRGLDDLPLVLESLGVERDSAIPIHALVDPRGHLRCVRVGAVGPSDYGTIKTIIGS